MSSHIKGHSAKFGSYTMMHLDSNIIDIQLVQVTFHLVKKIYAFLFCNAGNYINIFASTAMRRVAVYIWRKKD